MKARSLLVIFLEFILVGEDNDYLEIYDTNLNLLLNHKFSEYSGIREMILLRQSKCQAEVAFGTINGLKIHTIRRNED